MMPTLHAFVKSTQQKCKNQSELWEEEFKALVLFVGSYEYLLMQFQGTLLENSFGATNLNSALHYVHSESKILKRKVSKSEQER